MSTHNPVTNPKHYDLFPGQQSIDVIQAALTPEEFAGFCKGNALKYRLRAGEKGDAAEDLAKANWYRDRLWQIKPKPEPRQIEISANGKCLTCGQYHFGVGGLPCLNMKVYAQCNGNDPHPTTSPETSATRSPDSKLAKG